VKWWPAVGPSPSTFTVTPNFSLANFSN